MSFVSILDNARDFLLVPQELPVSEVLEIARSRKAQWDLASREGRNLPVRAGAARKLKELSAMLPLIEIEVELQEIEGNIREGSAPLGPRKHELRLRSEKLGPLIAALPDTDEKTVLNSRLADVANELAAAIGPDKKAISEIDILIEQISAKCKGAIHSQVESLQGEIAGATGRVDKLPAGTDRSGFEGRLAQLTAEMAALNVRGRIEQEVAQLEAMPATGTEFAEAIGKMAARIYVLPPGEARSALEERLRIASDRKPVAGDNVGDKTVILDSVISLEFGEALSLTPSRRNEKQPSLIPIHLIARSRFVLGRFPTIPGASSTADLSCPLNLKKVSREHVILQQMGRSVLASDAGTDGHPTNGSWVGERKLSSEPTPIRLDVPQEIVLGFGPVFSVLLNYLPSAAPKGPPIPNLPPTQQTPPQRPADRIAGCIRFMVPSTISLPVNAIWIFTDAGIGTDPVNPVVVFETGLPRTFGRIHYCQGAFWIEGVAPGISIGTSLRANEPNLASANAGEKRPVAVSEVVPLRSGDLLYFGSMAFEVSVGS